MDECKPKPDGPSCEYVERAVKSLEEKITQRMDLADKWVSSTAAQLDTRLDGMNHIRDELRERAQYLATRAEVDLKFLAIEERLKRVERLPELSSQVKVLWSALLLLILTILGLSGVTFLR